VGTGALLYPVAGGRFGPFPLPRWLLPGSEAREYVEDGRFHFDVRLLAPVTKALIVHYRGHLSAAPAQDPTPPPL